MKIFADELITVPSTGVPITPTSSVYDNVGGSRATVARVRVLTTEINYRHNSPPTLTNSLTVGTNGEFTVDGYDNIASLKIAALNNIAAQVYIQYGN